MPRRRGATTKRLNEQLRAFVRLRELLGTHRALAAKLAELEQRLGAHDEQIGSIIAAIRQLTDAA